jgi:hypothetical protein
VTVYVKKPEMGDFSDFERGQIVGVCLAEASMIKTATLLCVSKAIVSKAMSAFSNCGKTTIVKRNNERKSTMTQIDHSMLRKVVSKIIKLLQQR